MNKIVYDNYVFDDAGTGDGRISSGSFFIDGSLAQDELGINTLEFVVRYPLDDNVDTSLTRYKYATPCVYYQNDKIVGKFYLIQVERVSKYQYKFKCQSSIGLLDDTKHYGGIYNGETATQIIDEIIGTKIPYTIRPVFDKIKLYGWLPIATCRENLKQVLFASSGGIKTNQDGDIEISPINTSTPKEIPDNRVFDAGDLTYDTPISNVEIVEHSYLAVKSQEPKTLFKGELKNQSFTTPKGFAVTGASLVTWNEPCFDITVSGCSILNNEIGANYVVVTANPEVEIKGKPYLHSENLIQKAKPGYTGEQKTATVKDATLISLVNSERIADRVQAYYGNAITLKSSILLDDEKPSDTIALNDPFGDRTTGFLKTIEGELGSNLPRGDVEVILNFNPPGVLEDRKLVRIEIAQPPNKTEYKHNEFFDDTGMVVMAYYDDDSSAIVTNYTAINYWVTAGTSGVTLYYTEGGITKYADVKVTVKDYIVRIEVNKPANKSIYKAGQIFDPTGVNFAIIFASGKKSIVNFDPDTVDFYPKEPLTTEDISIEYRIHSMLYHGIANQSVLVLDENGDQPYTIDELIVEQMPNKIWYNYYDTFKPYGLSIAGKCSDGVIRPIEGYRIETKELPNAGNVATPTIKVSWRHSRDQSIINVNFTVNSTVIEAIEIINPPNKTVYYDGETFDKTGMKVRIKLTNTEDGNPIYQEMPNYALQVLPSVLSYGDKEVTISYGYVSISVPITVLYQPHDYTKSKLIEADGEFSLRGIGATHSDIRIVLIGGGSGGYSGADGHRGYGGLGGDNDPDLGKGGVAGTGGAGGRIVIENAIIPLTLPFNITVGAGGAGGISDGETPVIGSEGGITTFKADGFNFSSEKGAVPENGYTDIFTGEIFASTGLTGVAGGNAGSTLEYNGVTYRSGGEGKDLTYGSLGTAYGGTGGGPAVGDNGGKGGDASKNNSTDLETGAVTTVGLKGGRGGSGGDAIAPTFKPNHGNGGMGGNGGGGGGHAGDVTKQTQYSFRGNAGVGGSGSQGGIGSPGCVIIYYS